jgi:hypothetical protein
MPAKRGSKPGLRPHAPGVEPPQRHHDRPHRQPGRRHRRGRILEKPARDVRSPRALDLDLHRRLGVAIADPEQA